MEALATKPKVGWVDRDEELLAESLRTRTYSVPFSRLFEIEAKHFDGYVESFETKAYTKSLKVSDDGDVTISIGAKSDMIPQPTIPYPYHMIHNDVLFAFKRNKFNIGDEFALNFDLFSLDFALVVILHFDEGEGNLFIANVDEWIQNGRVNHSNRELQIYLKAESNRVLPLPAGKILMMDERVKKWTEVCASVEEKKGGKNG